MIRVTSWLESVLGSSRDIVLLSFSDLCLGPQTRPSQFLCLLEPFNDAVPTWHALGRHFPQN